MLSATERRSVGPQSKVGLARCGEAQREARRQGFESRSDPRRVGGSRRGQSCACQAASRGRRSKLSIGWKRVQPQPAWPGRKGQPQTSLAPLASDRCARRFATPAWAKATSPRRALGALRTSSRCVSEVATFQKSLRSRSLCRVETVGRGGRRLDGASRRRP
jgi:hypothetical protein